MKLLILRAVSSQNENLLVLGRHLQVKDEETQTKRPRFSHLLLPELFVIFDSIPINNEYNLTHSLYLDHQNIMCNITH